LNTLLMVWSPVNVRAHRASRTPSFKPGKNSWSYTEGITRYLHDVELTEQEDLQPTAVMLDQLEITPYAYEERIEADGDLVIDLKTRLASPQHATLQAMILRCRADASYFPVLRKGLQDTPRTTRFGKCTWSAHDGEFKHNLILVEQVYDQRESDPIVPLDYPRVGEAVRWRPRPPRLSPSCCGSSKPRACSTPTRCISSPLPPTSGRKRWRSSSPGWTTSTLGSSGRSSEGKKSMHNICGALSLALAMAADQQERRRTWTPNPNSPRESAIRRWRRSH
jgi:hypothetical protein